MNVRHRHLSDRSANRLKISCWNVNGLSKNSVFDNKLHNCDFLNQFRDCDVSIMSEIWGSEVNEIPGFDIIALSPPRKLKTKRSGRSSWWYFSGCKKIPYAIFFSYKTDIRLYLGKNR